MFVINDDLENDQTMRIVNKSDVQKNSDKPPFLLSVLLWKSALINIVYYIYTLKGTHSMGGVYLEPSWLFVYCLVPSPSFLIGLAIFYAISVSLWNKTEVQFPNCFKYVSIAYCALIPIMVLVFVNEVYQKWGNPSFYSITLWYIYFYGVMNYWTCIL